MNSMTTNQPAAASWVEESELEENEEQETFIEEYDILSSPNDWNVLTLVSFMESGAIRIPAFQRNYVWDIKKASRLIESLLLGLPVPQVFLYEQARNNFLVIDGQQRLLTTFFFVKGRIPRASARGALGQLLKAGGLDASAMADDSLFQDFKLALPSPKHKPENRFHRLKYEQLDSYKPTLDLRTLRNVLVKQVSPTGHSAIYEIFNRLNTGGVNLTPQEIRASLYHSKFMTMMSVTNLSRPWRTVLGRETPDARMADLEILIRSMALAMEANRYSSPMATFVNEFCIAAQSWQDADTEERVERASNVIGQLEPLGPEPFRRQGKFSPSLFEAVFVTVWRTGKPVDRQDIERLAVDPVFVASLQEGSTKTANVAKRLETANRILR